MGKKRGESGNEERRRGIHEGGEDDTYMPRNHRAYNLL